MSALPLDIRHLEFETEAVPDLRDLSARQFPRTYDRIVKRGLDILAASILVLIFSPLLVAVAVAVRISMGSGVIYRQARVGRGGVPFTIFKFRSMRHDRRAIELRVHHHEDRRISHKREDDPRHTDLGRWIRRLSLDELPQLFNVIKGDMSLVGPRPELVAVVRLRYQDWQHARHLVRPGITGLWQVSQRDGGLMCENSTADLSYIANLSLWTDLKIMARTPVATLKRTGS